MYQILVVDDDADIVNALRIYLTAEGYTVYTASNGEEALAVLKTNEIHLCLLDVMMPKMDGITCIAKIREQLNVPVILLTAKSEDTDRVLGLTIGADDYITKPFNPVELQARVKAQLRRYINLGGRQSHSREQVLSAEGVVLNDAAKTVTVNAESISLTPTEFDILKLLMEEKGTVYSSKEIYHRVWKDSAEYGAEATVAVHIRHLREKLEINPAQPRHLKVVWGQGYKFE